MRLCGILFLILFTSMTFAKEVDLRLSWKNQFQFAGFYVAKDLGYYKEKGIELNIHEYEHTDVIHEVIEEKMDFAIGKSSIIVDKAKGHAITALAALFQHVPSVLIATNPKIKRLEDLQNRRIMVTDDEINSIGIKAMLASKGITQENVIRQRHSFNLQDLIDGKTDAMASYISNEPYTLKKMGIDFTMFIPKDYGLDLYGDILYTSTSLVEKDPQLIRDFYEATMKGWKFAFENIQQSAELIYEKYNTQNKSLEHLIFEGETLKKMAFDNIGDFGTIDKDRLCEAVKIYKIFDVLPNSFELNGLIDPLGLGKKDIYIGVLAKRGKSIAMRQWLSTAEYLNGVMPRYHFKIMPLRFEEVDSAIANKEINFLVTNTMQYLQMSYKHGVSRIATMQKRGDKDNPDLSLFGSVIISKKSNSDIRTIQDLQYKNFGAVNKESFGGWIMTKDLLAQEAISEDMLNLKFFETHDNVVYGVLEGIVEVGTVRTGTLEQMQAEGKIDINDFKIINQRFYEDFPFLVSSKLYPEWPFAMLKHTSHKLATQTLSALLNLDSQSQAAKDSNVDSWTIPLDYSSVHTLLQDLYLYPYEKETLSIDRIIQEYQAWLYIFGVIILSVIFYIIYSIRINSHLKLFNRTLERQVKQRTEELRQMNKKLSILAHTDELTKIDNRRSFLQKVRDYSLLSERNKSPLGFLSLDIDHFKKVNDTHGHAIGDEVLKHFALVISEHLREIDIFGRVGGEEFAVCLQNTNKEGAKIIAEKLRETIEKTPCRCDEDLHVRFTVSIGLTQLLENEDISAMMQRADEALYKAKQSGRNRVEVI